jgi:hypothetical protein
MKTRPASASRSVTQIIAWRERIGVHRVASVFLIAALMAVSLWGAGALDHVQPLVDPRFLWRPYFMPIVLVPFILFGYMPVQRAMIAAEESLSRVISLPSDELGRQKAEALGLDQRLGWLIAVSFSGVGLITARLLVWAPVGVWLRIFALFSYALMTGLVARVLFETLALRGYFGALQRLPLEFDLFHPAPFEPLARFSLLLSSLLMGGVTLCIPLASEPQAALYIISSLTFGLTILVALLSFFLNLLGIHNTMSDVKGRALARVRSIVGATYEELTRRIEAQRWDEVPGVKDTLQALLAYEKRVQEAPEWPYTSVALRRLIASALVPVTVWAVDLVVRIKF